MTPERWQQVQHLLQAALERSGEERAALLESACAGDAALRHEVETLLASDEHVPGFLEGDAFQDAQLFRHDESGAAPGGRVGPYVIERRLGAGGMGEVFLAQDMRLGRKVALKLLDPTLIGDSVARARFVREARLASSLDHPNICTVYEIGETGERLFITMQFVDGETLQRTIGREPLDPELGLSVGLQVAEALAAAHARGIVHRDVKSGNIMVTPQGQAKVLDFGLAMHLARDEDGEHSNVTMTGAVIGTPGWLAPEQARGERVDHRSDIFSFGVVLYEIATGARPFQGRSRADVISAILHSQHVPAAAVNRHVSAGLSRLIDRTLAKEPSARYQSMDELIADLRAIAADSASSRPSTTSPGISGSVALGHQRFGLLHGASRRHVDKIGPAIAVAAAMLVIVSLALIATRSWRSPPHATPAPVRSIAVLPFKPLVASQKDEALEMGVADALIAKLSTIEEIDVRPISAVRKYDALDQDAIAAGREQRVDAVIEGQIQRSGDRVRVRVRLVSVNGGGQLWADEIEERLTDTFALQDAVSTRVSNALAVTLPRDQHTPPTKRHTDDVEAYQLYVRGRYHLTQLTDDGFWKALDYFRRAVAKDPDYALAHAGIAEAYFNLSGFNAIRPAEGFPKARQAAETALRIDDRLPEAHAALAGAIFLHDWDWSAADAAYRRALQLNPGSSDAHMAYGLYLATMGRFDEALRESQRALELDPLSPAKIAAVGDTLHMARRHDEAAAQYRQALDLDPNFGYGHWALGRALTETRQYDAAIAAIKKAIPLSGDSPDEVAELARTYAAAGRRTQALEVLESLFQTANRRYVAPTTFAALYAALGDRGPAFAWLERARADRDFLLVMIRVDPMFDNIRDDARFGVLLERMRLSALP